MKSFLKKYYPIVYIVRVVRLSLKKLMFSFPELEKRYLIDRYKNKFETLPNFESPKTFNEKILNRVLFDRNKKYTELSDKLLVRKYVEETIGPEYLIPLLGVYKEFHQVKFQNLPNQFVLKCNHDSGNVFICNKLSGIDFKKLEQELNLCLKTNYYFAGLEWHYRDITPVILCEEFIGNGNKVPKDYKFHVFNDRGEYDIVIQVDSDRYDGHKRNMLTEDWQELDFFYKVKNKVEDLDKPKNIELMLSLAKKLAQNFDYVRVDLYDLDGSIYFGEMTFTPEAGLGAFYPSDWDIKLGALWKQRFKNQ